VSSSFTASQRDVSSHPLAAPRASYAVDFSALEKPGLLPPTELDWVTVTPGVSYTGYINHAKARNLSAALLARVTL
jgi:hypothetical protein